MTDVCETAILQYLDTDNTNTGTGGATIIEDTYPWSLSQGLNHKDVVGAVKSLLVEEYVTSQDVVWSYYTLSAEAESIVAQGTQEMRVLQVLNEESSRSMTMPELQAKVGMEVSKIGMGNCMKNQWVKKEGPNLVPLKTMDEVTDTVREELQSILAKDGAPEALDEKVCFCYVTATVGHCLT